VNRRAGVPAGRSGGVPPPRYAAVVTKTVSVAEFCEGVHALLDTVVQNSDEVLIEKDGRVVAKLVRVEPEEYRGILSS
jgi:hypothetical protein